MSQSYVLMESLLILTLVLKKKYSRLRKQKQGHCCIPKTPATQNCQMWSHVPAVTVAWFANLFAKHTRANLSQFLGHHLDLHSIPWDTQTHRYTHTPMRHTDTQTITTQPCSCRPKFNVNQHAVTCKQSDCQETLRIPFYSTAWKHCFCPVANTVDLLCELKSIILTPILT